MASRRSVLICLVIALSLYLRGSSGIFSQEAAAKEVRLDAAFTIKGVLNLVANKEIMYVVDKKEVLKYGSSHFDLPVDLNITAAFGVRANIEKVLFYGENYGLFGAYFKDPFQLKPFKYRKVRWFIRDGGPDAAAKKGKDIYFFKGCLMTRRIRWHVWDKNVKNVTDIGLPCSPDAAWHEGEAVVVLKGNEIWYWEEDGSVRGPDAFNDHYTIKSWVLLPATQDGVAGGEASSKEEAKED